MEDVAIFAWMEEERDRRLSWRTSWLGRSTAAIMSALGHMQTTQVGLRWVRSTS